MSLKETQKYCLTQRNILKQEKCSPDDLRLLMNEILSTDAELYMAILNILKQGMDNVVLLNNCYESTSFSHFDHCSLTTMIVLVVYIAFYLPQV